MRIKKHIQDGKITGYTLWLSANDTYLWATKPKATWPCSKTRDSRIMVSVDQNGINDLIVNGKDYHDIEGGELDALICDHVPDDCKHLWPCWN